MKKIIKVKREFLPKKDFRYIDVTLKQITEHALHFQ